MDLKQVSDTVKSTRRNSGVEPLKFSSDKDSDISILTRTIKDEGLLLRNKGPNSIHSLKIKFEKFEGMFQTMNQSISDQTSILKKTLTVMTEENERRNIVDQINLLNQAEKRPTIINKYYGGRNNNNNQNNNNNEGGSSSFTFLPTMLGRGGLGVAGVLGSMIVVPLLAKISSEVVENLAMSTGFTEEFSGILGDSAFWGVLGGGIARAFSKKLGIYGMVAGAAWPLGEKMLDAAGIDGDKMLEIMGQNFELDQIAGAVMSAVSVGLLAFFKSKKFGDLLSTDLAKKGLAKGALLAGTVGAAIAANEVRKDPSTAQDKIEEYTGYRPDESLTKFGATVFGTAALGANRGPVGALWGAGAGVLLGFAEAIKDNKEKSLAPIEELLAKQKEDPNFVLSPEERKRIEGSYRLNNPNADGEMPLGTPLINEIAYKNQSIFEEDNKRRKIKPLNEVEDYVSGMLDDNDEYWRKHLSRITTEGMSTENKDRIINEFLEVLRTDIIRGNERHVMDIIRRHVNPSNSWFDWDLSTPKPAQVIKDREPFITPQFMASEHRYNEELKTSDNGVQYYTGGTITKEAVNVETPISRLLADHFLDNKVDENSPEFKADFYLSKDTIGRMLEEIGFTKEEISNISPSQQIEILSKKINHIDTSAAKKEGNVVVYAPNVTNAPITNITQGGSTVHNKTNIISPIQSPNRRHGGIQ